MASQAGGIINGVYKNALLTPIKVTEVDATLWHVLRGFGHVIAQPGYGVVSMSYGEPLKPLLAT